MALIYDALKKTGGSTDGDKLSPRERHKPATARAGR